MTRSTSFRFLAWFVSLLILPYLINSCKPDSTIVTTGNPVVVDTTGSVKSTINGQVISLLTGIPIDSALVHITGSTYNVSLLTDIQGKYTTEFELTGNVNFNIYTTKAGYVGDTTSITVTPKSTQTVPVISLNPVNSGGTKPSGDPVSIFLASQSAASIGIQGSGSPETATLTFEVQDSSGQAIDLDHSVNVRFIIATSPNGGEVISPTVVQTNNLGRASVNITSGTIAGVIQFTAQIDLPAKTLKSSPVSITIHGGLPDLNHLSIVPSQVNFPGYDIFNNTMTVTVIAGDKYSNPVRPNTSVYFNTTGGTIEGSAQTDDKGKGTVTLTSGNPKPIDAVLGAGFAIVTASTADENFQTIMKQVVILFSGYPILDISPTTFDIPNGGSQSFTYTLMDENGNPLSGGTAISVNAEGEDVATQGDINVTIPDTQSKSWTSYSFKVYDGNDSVNVAKPVTITINTTGPNGGAKISIEGTKH